MPSDNSFTDLRLTYPQAIGLYLRLRDQDLDLEMSRLLETIEKEILINLTLEERCDLECTYRKILNREK